MEGKKRMRYTAEFKIEAIRLLEQEGMTVEQVAKDLGLRTDQLRKWKRVVEGRVGLTGRDVFPGNGRLPAQEEEIRRLRRENEILRQERDLLRVCLRFR